MMKDEQRRVLTEEGGLVAARLMVANLHLN